MRVSLQRLLSVVEGIDHLIGDLELISVVGVILIGGLFERKESVVDLVPRYEDPQKRKGERKIDHHFYRKTQLHVDSITDKEVHEKLPDI